MNGKTIILLSLSGLASLLVENNLVAEGNNINKNREASSSLSEETIIKPSLEEIITLLPKTPQEILQPAIEKRDIKKFEYTRNTKPEDFYEFLRKKSKEDMVFVFLYYDEATKTRKENTNFWESKSVTTLKDRKVSSGSAITFLYINRNLMNRNKNIGFLFLELVDFYGLDNWHRLCKLFSSDSISFPSWAEFVKGKDNYKVKEIGSAGILSEEIVKYIELNVEEYSKKKKINK